MSATGSEILRAKADALSEFADATRMPWEVFEGVSVGDLMRQTAQRYREEAAVQESWDAS